MMNTFCVNRLAWDVAKLWHGEIGLLLHKLVRSLYPITSKEFTFDTLVALMPSDDELLDDEDSVAKLDLRYLTRYIFLSGILPKRAHKIFQSKR